MELLKKLYWIMMTTFDPYYNDIYSCFDDFISFYQTR